MWWCGVWWCGALRYTTKETSNKKKRLFLIIERIKNIKIANSK